MPEIDFEAAKRLQSMLTNAHPQWAPQSEPFNAKATSLGHFVSKMTFALGGATPDYVSVAFKDSVATVFIAAGDCLYLATASPDASSVSVFPFELDCVVVQEAPNVLRGEQFGIDALVVDIEFGDQKVTLPGHGKESNEDSLAAFFPELIKHLNG